MGGMGVGGTFFEKGVGGGIEGTFLMQRKHFVIRLKYQTPHWLFFMALNIEGKGGGV